jgi:phosphate transport system substrate-binding protein
VTAAIKQAQGAIGYAEVSYAKGAQLGIASIKNQAGSFVPPDAKNVSAALAEAQIPADLKVEANYKPTSADAYPISTPSFVIVYTNQPDPAKGKLLKAFLSYAVGSGQSSAESLFYAPLPAELASRAKAAVDAIKA